MEWMTFGKVLEILERDNPDVIKNGVEYVTEFTIPEGIFEKIDDYAFRGFTRLESITIPDSVRAIGKSAFEGCCSLSYVNLPKNLLLIADRAFRGCISLEEIKFPNTLELIGEGAFEDCCSIEEVRAPKSLKAIGSGAFFHCQSLRKINFRKVDLEQMGTCVFGRCRKIWYVPKRNMPKYRGEDCFFIGEQFRDTAFEYDFFKHPIRKIRFYCGLPLKRPVYW